MICNMCGRIVEAEGANFCNYCGHSFREETALPLPVQRVEPEGQPVQQPIYKAENEQKEETVGFGNWMGTLLIPWIPIVGSFVYIVMLFIWSFGSSAPASKKNWARAQLIVSAISMVIAVIFFFTIIIAVMSGEEFQSIMNSYSY